MKMIELRKWKYPAFKGKFGVYLKFGLVQREQVVNLPQHGLMMT